MAIENWLNRSFAVLDSRMGTLAATAGVGHGVGAAISAVPHPPSKPAKIIPHRLKRALRM